jgi:hypothetical protein
MARWMSKTDINSTMSKKLNRKKATLDSPEFNLREIAKQLILIEDHLFHKNKQCPDCLGKHFLMVEALAEEAITMDTTGMWTNGCETMANKTREWIDRLNYGDQYETLGQEVRSVRKQLTPLIFNPQSLKLYK